MKKQADQIEIVKYKVTTFNKKGKLMKHFKLMGIDTQGKEHYLKFISSDFAYELLEQSTQDEVIWETI